MPCWSCAVMSKIFRPSSCQKALDGTDGGATGHASGHVGLPGRQAGALPPALGKSLFVPFSALTRRLHRRCVGPRSPRHNAPLDQLSSWGSAVCRQPKPVIRKGQKAGTSTSRARSSQKRAARESARSPSLVPTGTGYRLLGRISVMSFLIEIAFARLFQSKPVFLFG